jgi:hypothetical protein
LYIGWLVRGVEERYAKDLLDGPLIRTIDRTFPLWVLLGFAFPWDL